MSVSSEASFDSEDREAAKTYGTSSLWFQVKKVRRLDIFFLLVNIVIGPQFRISFAENIWETFFDFFFTGIGYVCLAASLAEMISALPFSGGIYGIVRAFTHPFLGFYVACFELLISFLYLTQWMYEMSHTPIYAGWLANDKILYLVLASYVIVVTLCIFGGKIFWTTNTILAVATLGLIFIYIFGSIPNMNFDKYGTQDKCIDWYSSFRTMPPVSLAFIGIQFAPLSIQYSREPKKDIPMIMTYTMMFIVVVDLLLVVMIAFQYPGAAAVGDFPVSWGFSKMFNIPLEQTAWFTLPGLFATNFGFMYCFGRQATCMAGSGLLPSILKKHVPIVQTPWVALITSGLVCFLFSVFVSFNEDDGLLYVNLTTALASFVVYIFFFVAYLKFKITHGSLERSFTSPFGMTGAVVGIAVCIAGVVGTLGFQHNRFIPATILVAFSLFVFLIFCAFLRGTHEFSEEEKGELFKAYLINGKYPNFFSLIASDSNYCLFLW
jgi:amino acid transporter